MSYTEQMENALWQKYTELDGDVDSASVVDFLNNESEFRTFGDGLIALITKKYPDADAENMPKFLAEACKKNNIDIKIVASRNTLKYWFEGDKRPKKGEVDRNRMFALSFALNFTADETAELFHKVYLDRAFDFRNERELVYYFCISNDKSWDDAQRIINSIKPVESFDDKTIYTSVIKGDADAFSDESQLVAYIENHKHNFELNNKTAKEKMIGLVNKAKTFTVCEAQLPQNQEVYEGKWRTEDTVSNNFMFEVITEVSPSSKKGTTTIFTDARLPKEIKNRFPEVTFFAEKEPTYESIRKMIILLFSYEFWVRVQWGDITQTPAKKYNLDESEIFDGYTAQLNSLLNECGFSPLYYGNPYDWMFLYCTLSNTPLDSFRDMVSEVLSEDE